jgi:hypothetical protein
LKMRCALVNFIVRVLHLRSFAGGVNSDVADFVRGVKTR